MISVIMSAFNEEKNIANSIQSILDQTYQNFEFLIVNDGSTDRTREIVLGFSDPRIHLIDRSNGGYVSALNGAAQIAKGEFLARMDADDQCLPNRFERQLEAIQSCIPSLDVVCTGSVSFDNQNLVIGESFPFVSDLALKFGFCFGTSMTHGSVMMRTSAFRAAGGYRASAYPAEDYDLWVRLADLGFRFGGVPDLLYRYQVHPASTSSLNKERQRQVALDIRMRAQERHLPKILDRSKELGAELKCSRWARGSSRQSRRKLTKLLLRTGFRMLMQGDRRLQGATVIIRTIHAAPFTSGFVLFQEVVVKPSIQHLLRVRRGLTLKFDPQSSSLY